MGRSLSANVCWWIGKIFGRMRVELIENGERVDHSHASRREWLFRKLE